MLLEGIILLIAGADQAAKTRIEQMKKETFPQPLEKTGGKIILYRNHNAGFPFGVCQEQQQLVRMLPLVVTSMLAGNLIYLQKRKERPVYRLGLAMAIGGSLSNIYDRMIRHYVVDYFSFSLGFLKKVVFNLGDLFVFAGFAIMAVQEVLEEIQGVKSSKIRGKRVKCE